MFGISREDGSRRVLAAGAALVVLVLLVSSPAYAGHALEQELGLSNSYATPTEDDGAVVHAPRNLFDGVANRVVKPGRLPGDGARFLDARVGSGLNDATTHGDAVYGEFGVNAPIPGARPITAWYGEWSDHDSDGVIDDLAEKACGASPCAGDEFRWRGAVNGNVLAMTAWEIPHPTCYFGAFGFSADITSPLAREYHRKRAMVDMTQAEHPRWSTLDEFCSGADSGLLFTTYIVVVADAPPAGGTPFGFDLNDPEALIDVDEETSMDPDLESLYASMPSRIGSAGADAVRAINDVQTPVNALVKTIRDDVTAPVTDATEESVDEVDRIATEGFQGANREATRRQREVLDALAQRQPKEPNHMDDDYGGFALFDGVTDSLGEHNSYPGYQDAYHLWVDITLKHAMFGEGSAGTVALDLYGIVYLWRDWNLDAQHGYVCDPSTPDFDADANVCRTPRAYSVPNRKPELVAEVCRAAIIDHVLVEPVSGNWPPAVVLRESATGSQPEVPQGRTPIALRADSAACAFEVPVVDRLVFPEGLTTPLRTTARWGLERFVDLDLGIEALDEWIVDVDIILPRL